MDEKIVQSDAFEIDLLEVLHVFLRKWWLILTGALVGAIAMLLLTTYAITPMYRSQAMLYIFNKSTTVASLKDFQLGGAISEDFIVIAQSKPVLDGTVEVMRDKYGKEFTRGQIAGMLDVSNKSSTRILVIGVTCADPEDACQIANVATEVMAEQMAVIMGTSAPNILERAEVSAGPVSPNMQKNVLLGFAGGVFLICLILFVQYLLNDTIRNEEEVTKYLGVSTLATLPLISDKERKKAEARKKKKQQEE